MLIEGNGHYGLIDSSKYYKIIKNKSKYEKYNKHSKNENNKKSVIIDYLKLLKIKKLDFIIGTHAHSDHIGGFELISNKYIDKTTIFYYKKYDPKLNKDKYVNYTLYLNVINSFKKKNVKLIDVTNKNIIFNFGDLSTCSATQEHSDTALKAPGTPIAASLNW